MTYKSMLTIHSINDPVETIEPIINLSKSEDAHLDIIVLGGLITPAAYAFGTVSGAHWVENNTRVCNEANDRVNEIEKLVQEANLSANVAPECAMAGMVEDAIVPYALCADLAVLSTNTIRDDNLITKAFHGALFETGCPILLFDTNSPDLSSISRIVIAWNGEKEAAKAVRFAMPLLVQADKVHVAIIDPSEAVNGLEPGVDIAAYLARHDVNVTVKSIASGGKSSAEVLLQHSADLDAELLVMGGYGHSKLEQWFFGAATGDILKSAKIPVLMAH